MQHNSIAIDDRNVGHEVTENVSVKLRCSLKGTDILAKDNEEQVAFAVMNEG